MICINIYMKHLCMHVCTHMYVNFYERLERRGKGRRMRRAGGDFVFLFIYLFIYLFTLSFFFSFFFSTSPLLHTFNLHICHFMSGHIPFGTSTYIGRVHISTRHIKKRKKNFLAMQGAVRPFPASPRKKGMHVCKYVCMYVFTYG